jgi:hypothetical protein
MGTYSSAPSGSSDSASPRALHAGPVGMRSSLSTFSSAFACPGTVTGSSPHACPSRARSGANGARVADSARAHALAPTGSRGPRNCMRPTGSRSRALSPLRGSPVKPVAGRTAPARVLVPDRALEPLGTVLGHPHALPPIREPARPPFEVYGAPPIRGTCRGNVPHSGDGWTNATFRTGPPAPYQ